MIMNSILAFAIIALTFALGDYIALKTKGMVSTFITAIIIFILFGGVLNILPDDLMELSGLTVLIPTFGMILILTNLGSTLDLNALKKEWRTIVVSLLGIIGLLILGFSLGQFIFGREYALGAIGPISGGIIATMISSDAANAAGRGDIASYIAAVNALQVLIGLPLSSFCLNKAAKSYISNGFNEESVSKDSRKIDIRILPDTPKPLDNPTAHFARLAFIGLLAQLFSDITGLNNTISYLLFGAVGAAIGIVESGSLKKAGGEGILLLATYAYVSASFLSMSLSEFASILVPIFGMLMIGGIGIAFFSSIAGILFKWSPFLSIAIGFSCMLGYPMTYTIAMEVANGISIQKNFTEEQRKDLIDYLLPKMLIAGVATVSVASVVIAGTIAPRIF